MDEYILQEYTDPVDGVTVLPTTGDEPGVTYIKDLVYADYGTVRRTLQLLIPSTRNHQFPSPVPPEIKEKYHIPDFNPDWSYPCIVYVPGSAWGPQNVYGVVPSLAKYTALGYIVAIVQYRDYTVDKFPAPIVDARNAVRFLRLHAKEYALNPAEIILAGDSSGGHTAAYAGIFHDDDKETNLYPGVSGEVKGIVNFYGSTDVTFFDSNPVNTWNVHCKEDSPEGMEMGGIDLTDRTDLQELLTVRCQISEDTDIVPMLIFHGTFDHVVNCKCSIYLYEALKKAGKDVTLYLLQGADHGGPEFSAPQVLEITDRFIRRVLS